MSDLRRDYTFHLPPERIAQQPATQRDASRLMLLQGAADPTHYSFRDLPTILQPGDLLVRNDTRVFPARLRGRRPGGGKIELLLTQEIAPLPNAQRWRCLARPAGSIKPEKPLTFGDGKLTALLEDRGARGEVIVQFPNISAESFFALLEEIGEVPLPPYINRTESGPDACDADRYQTIYARERGAVAAPTAGLHFTPEVEAQLGARGIELAQITLHVGPGTFRPMTVDCIKDHRMDAEKYEVNDETAARITQARRQGRRIIAVGTTTTRTLESITDDDGVTHPGRGATDLFIRPGHRWRGIDGLITNFHLPESSLLVLVSALAGRERILAAYQDAIIEGYRFYSYGDAMLILPESE